MGRLKTFMGVLGLTPFLQKACPKVIKYLPQRLKTLAGSRIVIDGTLITQRVHFVPLNHPYRHVLGWYRLVKELQEFNVSALVVFDGKERNIAKAKEALKRQEAKRLTSARELIEQDRLDRLKNLGRLLSSFAILDVLEKNRIARLVKDSAPRDEVLPPLAVPDYTIPETSELALDPFASEDAPDYRLEDVPSQSASYLSVEQVTSVFDLSSLESELPPRDDYAPVLSKYEHQSFTHFVTPPPLEEEEDIACALITLYQGFRDSIPKVASLPRPPATMTMDDPVARTEYMMSKGQYQLTLDEGRLWERLREADQKVSLGVPVEETLQAIFDRSSHMSESYARRTNPPTAETYAECREILEAMGVHCIETEGPYEAEALASSLVLNGYADYVASEDTDVIVYDAPLLRNLSNRQSPLMILSGPDIRNDLQLSRDSFVDFAILLGTDFSQRIKNVGPARALKFVKEYGTIERIVEIETKYPPRTNVEDYLEEVAIARRVFQTLPPISPAMLAKKGTRDDVKVRDIMSRYQLGREVEWDHDNALSGNFFGDDPGTGAQPDSTTFGLYV